MYYKFLQMISLFGFPHVNCVYVLYVPIKNAISIEVPNQ